MLIVAITSSWADEVTVTSFKSSSSTPYTYECISNNYAVNEVEIITSNVTSNPVGNGELKVPANGTLTVSAHGKSVTGIEISWKNTPSITANVGEISTSSKVTTWEGNAESVVLTSTTANQFGTITVTYAGTFADNIGSTVTLSSLTRGLYSSSSIYTIGCTTDPSVYGVYMKGKIGSDINIDSQSNSGTISFKSPKAMSSIVLNWTDSKGASKNPNMTPSIGTYNATTKTWSAPSGNTSIKEVTFTNAETSKYYLKNQNVVINFASSGPSLSVDPAEANAFTYVAGNGPSAAQEFTVNLSNSEKAVSATLDSENYEMSKTSDGTYASTAITDLENGSKVYVRLKAGLAKGTGYDGTLTFANEDVTDDVVVNLSGSVTVPKCATPTISPVSFSTDNQEVTITSETADATIYYTTDGTDPTESSNVYDSENKPTISSTTTFKAIAVKENYDDSEVATQKITRTSSAVVASWNFTNWSSTTQAGVKGDTEAWSQYEKTNSGGMNFGENGRSNIGAISSGSTLKYNETNNIDETNGLTFAAGAYGLALIFNIGSATVSSTEYTYQGSSYLWLYSKNAIITIPSVPAGATIEIGVESHNGGDERGVTLKNGSTTLEQTQGEAKSTVYQVCKWTNATAGNVTVTPSAGLHIYYIKVTGNAETVPVATSAGNTYATYVTESNLDFSSVSDEITAYIATADNGSTITTEAVTEVPTGTALLIKTANAGATVNVPVAASTPATLTANKLKYSASPLVITSEQATAKQYYGFFKVGGKYGFAPMKAGTLAAKKAYLDYGVGGNSLQFIALDFDDAPTAINFVEAENNANSAAPVKVIKNGKLFIGNYNVAGQQVK